MKHVVLSLLLMASLLSVVVSCGGSSGYDLINEEKGILPEDGENKEAEERKEEVVEEAEPTTVPQFDDSQYYLLQLEKPTFTGLAKYDVNQRYPYILSKNGNFLCFNILGRGIDNGNTWQFYHKTGEEKDVFPLGRWLSRDESGESLYFTKNYFFRFSPYFDVALFKYKLDGDAMKVNLVKIFD